uniref:Gnk2-homologous domain-containing protein n=1 Tax=Brassica campestris TaxID=3711 RepID=M4DAZ8_BRACM
MPQIMPTQTCMDNRNGTYERNRRLILSSFPSNVTTQEGLFYNGSIGQEPNRVYAVGMCIPGIQDQLQKTVLTKQTRLASTSKSTPSSSNNHYKADMAPLTALENIYALMQCTPDLSSGDCDNCLRQSARDYQSCCGQKQGGVLLLLLLLFLWLSPPPEDDQARTTNNGIVSQRLPSMNMRPCFAANSDILTPQSSQYDFKTIEAATNKFSRSNKLGEGGFGEVALSNGIEVAVKRLSKKSDIGLSTIFAMEQTRGNTRRIAGTYGYMSFEYAMQGQYSMKSDIYRFGVLLLKIISGKKNGDVYQMDETSTDGNLITYVSIDT